METLIINAKNASSAKFILELVTKLGESGKILSKEEKEDFFLGSLMDAEKTNEKVSRETIFKKLKSLN
ncbi:MAG: hypothetical protein CFE24_10475 [Flavobacterium sp. BFFFF2]|nr:MAG: hypothetical protein CFE24_10475 [Flavobacterium sp. BFFFF2]